MTRTPITALLFAALLGAQATVALAAGTGPTNPAPATACPTPPFLGPGWMYRPCPTSRPCPTAPTHVPRATTTAARAA